MGRYTEMGKRKIFAVELTVIPEVLIVLIHMQAEIYNWVHKAYMRTHAQVYAHVSGVLNFYVTLVI